MEFPSLNQSLEFVPQHGSKRRADDLRRLRQLADSCGDELKLGVVLYDGMQVLPFGERNVCGTRCVLVGLDQQPVRLRESQTFVIVY